MAFTPREDEIFLLVGINKSSKKKLDNEDGNESLDSINDINSEGECNHHHKEQEMKRKDSIYFLEIKIDKSFIAFLDFNDKNINTGIKVAKRLIRLTTNKNFVHLILNELQERRLKKS
jgi:hypothetical protein